MEKQEFDALVTEVGLQAATKIKTEGEALEKRLNEKYDLLAKGQITREELDQAVKAEATKFNEMLLKFEKLEQAVQKQGTTMTELLNGASGGNKASKSLEDFFGENMAKIIEVRKNGVGTIEWSGSELRKAGVNFFPSDAAAKAAGTTSVGGNSIATMAGSALTSPYLPGLGGTDLELFDIRRNPNWIITRVDMGTTNQSKLAWINEVTVVGTDDVAGINIAESGTKTLVQHKFQVEYSTAKKAAAYMILTEEFQDDLPGLASEVRTMLREDVLRAFDDQVQALLIAASRPYEITGLNASVPYSTLYDAVWSMWAQIGFYNFVPNTIAMNTVTDAMMMMDKSQYNYWTPSFIDRLMALLIDANKVAVGFALVGDLTQFKVRIYKDFTLRVGWINTQLITNEFCVVGEMRFHAYISDNRKKALCYNRLTAVQSAITSGS